MFCYLLLFWLCFASILQHFMANWKEKNQPFFRQNKRTVCKKTTLTKPNPLSASQPSLNETSTIPARYWPHKKKNKEENVLPCVDNHLKAKTPKLKNPIKNVRFWRNNAERERFSKRNRYEIQSTENFFYFHHELGKVFLKSELWVFWDTS